MAAENSGSATAAHSTSSSSSALHGGGRPGRGLLPPGPARRGSRDLQQPGRLLSARDRRACCPIQSAVALHAHPGARSSHASCVSYLQASSAALSLRRWCWSGAAAGAGAGAAPSSAALARVPLPFAARCPLPLRSPPHALPPFVLPVPTLSARPFPLAPTRASRYR